MELCGGGSLKHLVNLMRKEGRTSEGAGGEPSSSSSSSSSSKATERGAAAAAGADGAGAGPGKNTVLPLELIQQYTQQILLALQYLHTRAPPIVHRDLKSANVLLSDDGVVKLGDFGASKELSETMSQLSLAGTPHFMAPEAVMQDRGAWVGLVVSSPLMRPKV